MKKNLVDIGITVFSKNSLIILQFGLIYLFTRGDFTDYSLYLVADNLTRLLATLIGIGVIQYVLVELIEADDFSELEEFVALEILTLGIIILINIVFWFFAKNLFYYSFLTFAYVLLDILVSHWRIFKQKKALLFSQLLYTIFILIGLLIYFNQALNYVNYIYITSYSILLSSLVIFLLIFKELNVYYKGVKIRISLSGIINNIKARAQYLSLSFLIGLNQRFEIIFFGFIIIGPAIAIFKVALQFSNLLLIGQRTLGPIEARLWSLERDNLPVINKSYRDLIFVSLILFIITFIFTIAFIMIGNSVSPEFFTEHLGIFDLTTYLILSLGAFSFCLVGPIGLLVSATGNAQDTNVALILSVLSKVIMLIFFYIIGFLNELAMALTSSVSIFLWTYYLSKKYWYLVRK